MNLSRSVPSSSRLASESVQRLLVMPGQSLDRNITLEAPVLAAPDSTEATAAKFFLNEVPVVQEHSRTDGHPPPRCNRISAMR